ncbi:MAG: EcsC family protein [bacterium]
MKKIFSSQEEKVKSQILTIEEKQDLIKAKQVLENPSVTIKLANHIGRPVELLIEKANSEKLTKVTEKALTKSLDIALFTLNKKDKTIPSNRKHKLMTAVSGGVGGVFGLSALAIELPISTTIMLRSIADIAESQGHDLNELETRMACLEVFSLGSSKSIGDDGAESAYFAARVATAHQMKLAIDTVANMNQKAIQDALSKGQLPMLIQVIQTIASRFGITVSEKLVAQTIPIIGAVGGASINLIFMNHFQNMAEGHFIVKRLEKKYGAEMIQHEYNNLKIIKDN